MLLHWIRVVFRHIQSLTTLFVMETKILMPISTQFWIVCKHILFSFYLVYHGLYDQNTFYSYIFDYSIIMSKVIPSCEVHYFSVLIKTKMPISASVLPFVFIMFSPLMLDKGSITTTMKEFGLGLKTTIPKFSLMV